MKEGGVMEKRTEKTTQIKEGQTRVGLPLSGACEVFLDIWLPLLTIMQLFSAHSSLCTDRIFMKPYSTGTNNCTTVRETDWFQLVKCAALLCFKSH